MIHDALIVSAVLLMLDARLRSALAAYVIFTGATLWLAIPHDHRAPALMFFLLLGMVKLFAGPALIITIVKRYGVPENLSTSFNLAWRFGIAVGVVSLGGFVGTLPAFAHIALARTVFTAVFASGAIFVLHRNLLAHVIGLLAFGSCISLAGAVFAPGLSGASELADTFDVVLATIVALAVARALLAFDPKLDVRSLRGLRG